jgi:xanthine dehydrogenase molybdenum-binding subunit
MTDLSIVGKSQKLIDGVEKATGSAKFTFDVQLPRMLHVKTLRSPHPHAVISNIDTSKAEKMPGVKAVLTHKNVPPVRLLPWGALITRGMFVLDKRVRFVGDEVAAVAAVDEYTAQDALDLIEVGYEVLPAVFDPEEALKPGAVNIHPEGDGVNPPGNVCGPAPWTPWSVERGNVEQGFKEADHIFEDSYWGASTQAAALEPKGCVASWEGDRLTVWTAIQSPYELLYDMHRVLGVPMSKMKIINGFVGGGFGSKNENGRICFIAALLAKMTGRPVRYVYTREEEFIAGRRKHAVKAHMKLGLKRDGTITALQGKVVFDVGAYGCQGGGSVIAWGPGWLPTNTYRSPIKWELWDVATNLPTSGTMRGTATTSLSIFLESLVDKAATELGIGPLEIRLKNAMRPGDPVDGGITKISSCGLDKCLKIGAEKIGWKNRKQTGAAQGTKRRGIGVGMHVYDTGWWRAISSAIVKIQEDGSVNLFLGAVDFGQGFRTSAAQMAAEVLGVPLESVRVTNNDTDAAPSAPPTAGSISVICVGPAVIRASEDAKRQLLRRASDKLGAGVDNLEVGNGRVYVKGDPGKWVPFGALCVDATIQPSHPPFPGETAPTGTIVGKGSNEQPYFPYTAKQCGAHFAEVEVDMETGKVTPLKMVVVHDCGTPINPSVVEGQLEGASAMGVGYALSEEIVFDGEKMVNPSFMDFKFLTAKEMPDIEPVIIDSYEQIGPFGGKGVGEGAIISTPSAIANAIYNATGVQLKERPMTPRRMLKALKEGGIK